MNKAIITYPMTVVILATLAAMPKVSFGATEEAISMSIICPDGDCPDIGHAVYAPNVNLLKTLKSPKAIFNKEAMKLNEGCVTGKQGNEVFQELFNFNSSTEFHDSVSTFLQVSASIPVEGLTLKSTNEYVTGKTSTTTDAIHSASLEFGATNYIFGMDWDCAGEAALSEGYLDRFQQLPMINNKTVHDKSTWGSYKEFLKQRGSHVVLELRLVPYIRVGLAQTQNRLM
jgi:hypothetical protein